MELYSLAFFLFVIVTLICYYTVFRRRQWICLLAASLAFYCLQGWKNLLFLLLTSFTVWAAAGHITKIEDAYREAVSGGVKPEEKKERRRQAQRGKRTVLVLALLFNFGILAWLKYWNVLFPSTGGLHLLLPLGISFYTFQAAGCLIDAYGGKCRTDRNYFRFLLFVSWFPQLIQGPINRYDRLEPQLLSEHTFRSETAKRALLLFAFGAMKKYAVADMLSGDIAAVLDGSLQDVPGSLTAFSILLYSIQQYADFSGGIDMVMAVSQLFGIAMAPNFRQPYFSVSLGDFWRRWHITLGQWMRDYVFYPFALLKPMQRFGKWCGRKLGRHFGRVLPAGIANLLVFFLVGIWHGAQMHYVVWGLYNGIVIALSDILQPAFRGLSEKLRIRTETKGFHLFRILRTFLIVNIGWYFDRITDFRESLTALYNTFFRFRASNSGRPSPERSSISMSQSRPIRWAAWQSQRQVRQ
jgi:alginate O-acetyltransferase complex protein AlgI